MRIKELFGLGYDRSEKGYESGWGHSGHWGGWGHGGHSNSGSRTGLAPSRGARRPGRARAGSRGPAAGPGNMRAVGIARTA